MAIMFPPNAPAASSEGLGRVAPTLSLCGVAAGGESPRLPHPMENFQTI